MLSGTKALARAPGAARPLGAWSFPGAPPTGTLLLLEQKGSHGMGHRFTVHEQGGGVARAGPGAVVRTRSIRGRRRRRMRRTTALHWRALLTCSSSSRARRGAALRTLGDDARGVPLGSTLGRLEDEHIDELLGRLGGRVPADVDPVVRTVDDWKTGVEGIAVIGDDDGEPCPLYLAHTRGKMTTFAAHDSRLTLLRSLRSLERPTIIVADPGAAGVLGIRDRLVDVKMNMGSAAPVGGALADAAEVEEQGRAPLAVTLIDDTNHYPSELLGVLDNAISRREVLHVIVVGRRLEATAGAGTPSLPDMCTRRSCARPACT